MPSLAPSFAAVVAGHICLDLFPDFDQVPAGKLTELITPGHLVMVGPMRFMTGGPVSNTGLALHRLGIHTRLIGKIGRDPLGNIVHGIVGNVDPALAGGLVSDPDSPTSYSVIISAPGVDRIFIHCPGANDTFGPDDIDYGLLQQARLFHFGYPPIMRRMYSGGGRELVEIFRRAKETGVTTSLDMSSPDPESDSGRSDWASILRDTLPHVDLFLPSFEELLFMLQREDYDHLQRISQAGDIFQSAPPELISELGSRLLEMGVKIAVIKLGSRGLYVRTASEAALAAIGRAAPVHPAAWADKELRSACFQVQVIGTTGSGDSTIAGFLSALLRGMDLREAATMAVAVGACNVEAADALSGLCSWDDTRARVQAGWQRHPLTIDAPDWHQADHGLWEKTNS